MVQMKAEEKLVKKQNLKAALHVRLLTTVDGAQLTPPDNKFPIKCKEAWTSKRPSSSPITCFLK